MNLSRHNSLIVNGFFFVSTFFTNVGYYVFNVIMAHLLVPSAFSDLVLITTFVTLVTLVTVTINTVAARFVSIYIVRNELELVYKLQLELLRYALILGIFSAAIGILSSSLLQQLFHTNTAVLFVILSIGLPFVFILAVERGILQGQKRFFRLGVSLQVEMWSRLLIGVIFVLFGFSVIGATLGITISFIIPLLVGTNVLINIRNISTLDIAEKHKIRQFIVAPLIALMGQVIINNSDILIVKHFFSPDASAQYSTVALIGRIVFFATWPLTVLLFPAIVHRYEQNVSYRSLLISGFTIAALIGGTATLTVGVFPEWIMRTIFGATYLPVALLMWRYALATTLYVLANVVNTYQLALGRKSSSQIIFVFSIIQTFILCVFNSSLETIVNVQIVIMAFLLLVLLLQLGSGYFLQQRKLL